MNSINRIIRTSLKKNAYLLARNDKNPWDSIKTYPYMPVDEHEPPKDSEIISQNC